MPFQFIVEPHFINGGGVLMNCICYSQHNPTLYTNQARMLTIRNSLDSEVYVIMYVNHQFHRVEKIYARSTFSYWRPPIGNYTVDVIDTKTNIEHETHHILEEGKQYRLQISYRKKGVEEFAMSWYLQ